MWLCTETSANNFIAVVHLTIYFFLQLQAFNCFHCSIFSYYFIHSLLLRHFENNYYTYYYRLHGLAFIKQTQLHITLQLSTTTHFLLTIITHVGIPNGVNTGPMQHWLPFLTTATPFKSQKILFKARAPGSNLPAPTKRRLSTSHLPIKGQCWNLSFPLTQFSPFLSRPPILDILCPSPRAPWGSAIHVILGLDFRGEMCIALKPLVFCISAEQTSVLSCVVQLSTESNVLKTSAYASKGSGVKIAQSCQTQHRGIHRAGWSLILIFAFYCCLQDVVNVLS